MFLDADRRRCLWISGDPRRGGRQCEHRAVEMRPYCCAHMRRAYKAPAPTVAAVLDVDSRTVRALPAAPNPFE